jgi:membrane associated rhomboid family serine protease
MIPLRDENPTRNLSFITILIIAINSLVFIYELSLGSNLETKMLSFGVIPYKIIQMQNFKIIFTFITSLFLHASFIHLIGNMLYLWVFGNNIEDRLGHFKFIIFYLSCGILASLGYLLTAPQSQIPAIGASGAISGVLGVYLYLYPRARILVLVPFFGFFRIVKLPAIYFLGFWIILQFVYGTVNLSAAGTEGGVAWFAHITGFFAGLILLPLFIRKRKIEFS